MSDLDKKKEELKNNRSRLDCMLAEKETYLAEAKEMRKIYDDLKDDKDLILTYRKSVNAIKKEHFDTFKGDLYKKKYKLKIIDLVESYDSLISRIDVNMDRLNSEIARVENKAYECDGVIGWLKSKCNSLVHEIENWVN